MADNESSKSTNPKSTNRRRRTSTFNDQAEFEIRAPRRMNSIAEDGPYAPAQRRGSLSSTTGRNAEYRVPASISTPYLSTGFATQSRQQGLDHIESIQSPIGVFLDDSSSGDSEADETDVEYDSDTASSILSREEEREDRLADIVSLQPSIQPSSSYRTHSIIHSRYVSYGDEGSDMALELKLGRSEGADESSEVFRWVHLEEEIMDFERFTETSLQALRVSLQEKLMIKEKLQSVRKRYESSFFAQYATQGRNMDSFIFQQLWLQPVPSQSHLNRKIAVGSFPFFLLEDYMKRVRLRSPTTEHPPLTLLQSIVSSTEPGRDMRQVVCKSDVKQKQRCFYVGQLWYLILDDSQIFTCARLPEEKLCGDVISIQKEPTSGAPYIPFIKVTDGGNCTWHIRLSESRTWFDFTANFMEISSSVSDVVRRFEDLFRITMNGRTIQSHDWENVVKRACERLVHLVLTRRTQAQRLVVVHNPSDDDTYSPSESDKLFPWELDEAPPAPGHDRNVFTEGIDAAEYESFTRTASYDFASNLHQSGAVHESTDAEPRAGSGEGTKYLEGSTSNTPDTRSPGTFHALTYFSPSSRSSKELKREEPDDLHAEKKTFPNLLASIHQKLLRNVHEHDKRAYENCAPKELPEVTKYLMTVTRKEAEGYVQGLSALDTFFVAAVQVFEFFLPLENESELAKRYWGSAHFIMKNVLVDSLLASSRSTTRSMTAFKRLAHITSILQKELSKPQGPDIASTGPPAEFRKAWLHCILYLALFRFKSKYTKERERHLEKCEALLERGRRLLWRNSAKVPLHKKEVATPLAFMSVIIGNIVKDVNRHGDRLFIARIYRQYWKELEANVKSGRVKTAQQDIINLQQEVRAIYKTLYDQLMSLKDLYEKIEDQSTGWSSLSSRRLDHAPRPEMPQMLECIEFVENRIKIFQNIETGSRKLEQWMKEQIATTKHRHENAIYVFTIVTVVFLPLSFVCSFLGMNTAGIRDMDSSQWVFWAAALPLTFLIVLLALVWTDELGHAWTAVRKLFGLDDTHIGFTTHHDRSAYWKMASEKKGKWKRAFKGKKLSREQPVVTVPHPAPSTRTPPLDPWEKSYRRTDTFRSVVE